MPLSSYVAYTAGLHDEVGWEGLPVRYSAFAVALTLTTVSIHPTPVFAQRIDVPGLAGAIIQQAIIGAQRRQGVVIQRRVHHPPRRRVVAAPREPRREARTREAKSRMPPAAMAAKPTEETQSRAETRRQSTGTGFFVGGEGQVLTNAHVVDGCRSVAVRWGEAQAGSVRLLARDETNDLALLKTDLRPAVVAAMRNGARLGENIAAFGYPLNGLLATSGNFTLGNITAVAGMGDDTRHLQISAPVQPGNSGGPLLDQSGNVVGVVVGKLNAIKLAVLTNDVTQNVNFAIKASVAANFLESNGVPFATGTPGVPLDPADIADRAKSLSVFLECRA